MTNKAGHSAENPLTSGPTKNERPAEYGMFNPTGRPLNLYHLEDRNHCPNCSGLHWYIGRLTAECAHCGTALSLSVISGQTQHPLFSSKKSSTAES